MSPPLFKPFFPFPFKSILKGLLSLSRGACGREARRARPQAPRDPPGRFSGVVTSVLSFTPRAVVRRHRGLSGLNVAVRRRARRRVQAPVRFGRPTVAGPVTKMPNSGRCDVPGGGTHLDGRCRGPRRTMRLYGHTPCPESPEGPFGPPGRSVSSARFRSGPRPSTGPRPRARPPWWRTATGPPAACAPAPRSRACAPARRVRSRSP